MIAATLRNRTVNLQLNRVNDFSNKKLDCYPHDDDLRSCLKPPQKESSFLQRETETRRVNKRVCIDRTQQIFFIDSDYSDDEWHRSFWSNEEYTATVKRCGQIADILSINHSLDESIESSRGIERFTVQGRWLSMQNYYNAQRVVLVEQEALWDICNSKDEVTEALADNYSDYAKRTANAARLLGLSDERVAWKIHTENCFEQYSIHKLSTSLALGYKPRRMSM